MKPELRRLFRIDLLRQLAEVAPQTLSAPQLMQGSIAAGFAVTEIEVGREMEYNTDKGFAIPVVRAISPELKEWRISAPGRDLLAQEGLA